MSMCCLNIGPAAENIGLGHASVYNHTPGGLLGFCDFHNPVVDMWNVGGCSMPELKVHCIR